LMKAFNFFSLFAIFQTVPEYSMHENHTWFQCYAAAHKASPILHWRFAESSFTMKYRFG
jgi:hypothetical protein